MAIQASMAVESRFLVQATRSSASLSHVSSLPSRPGAASTPWLPSWAPGTETASTVQSLQKWPLLHQAENFKSWPGTLWKEGNFQQIFSHFLFNISKILSEQHFCFQEKQIGYANDNNFTYFWRWEQWKGNIEYWEKERVKTQITCQYCHFHYDYQRKNEHKTIFSQTVITIWSLGHETLQDALKDKDLAR